jgi:hypothetical protein
MTSSLTNPGLPLPGGYTFQPVTPELLALFQRVVSPLVRLIPIYEKFVPQILRARTNIGRKIVRSRMALATDKERGRFSVAENAIGLFFLTQKIERSVQLLDAGGRDALLRAAWTEFASLKSGEFEQLAWQAGEFLGQHILSDMIKRGAK